jgi:hypothetical protein
MSKPARAAADACASWPSSPTSLAPRASFVTAASRPSRPRVLPLETRHMGRARLYGDTLSTNSPRSWGCSRSTERRLHRLGEGKSGGANARWWPTFAAARLRTRPRRRAARRRRQRAQRGLRHRQRFKSQTKVAGNRYSPRWLVLTARHEDPAGVLERGIGVKGYPGTFEISSFPAEVFFSRSCGTKGQLRRRPSTTEQGGKKRGKVAACRR